MTDPVPAIDQRQLYQQTLARALWVAEQQVSADEAADVAQEVASELMMRAPSDVTGALIFMAVNNRLRNRWRAGQRRAATEGAYLTMRPKTAPAWADPAAELELDELQDRIERTLADMPAGMRDVFLLIRERGLSYRDTAARLGIAVATVHTQLSRANALLRDCVRRYEADEVPAPASGARALADRRPMKGDRL